MKKLRIVVRKKGEKFEAATSPENSTSRVVSAEGSNEAEALGNLYLRNHHMLNMHVIEPEDGQKVLIQHLA